MRKAKLERSKMQILFLITKFINNNTFYRFFFQALLPENY